MLIKTFEAMDMKEALSRVKSELGRNAVILSHRKIKKGDSSFGLFGRSVVEVTAAVDESAGDEPRKKHRRAKKDTSFNTNELLSAIEPLRDEIKEMRELIGSSASAAALGRSELRKAAGLADELQEIKTLTGFMLEQSDFVKGSKLDPASLVCYRRMVERGLEPETALKLLQEVKESVPGGRNLDLKHIVMQIVERIGEAMIIGQPILPANGESEGPRVVSLIGTTGVGKTTTIAKIAAELTIKGHKVGLITIDTYRIAAVEQLKSYADILCLPLKVVLTPDELLDAVSAFHSKDVVLIDTAGRSQRDAQKLDELAAFLGGDGLIENYLVISAASDPASIDESVRNFSCVPVCGLIFTKLDETTKPGIVISQNLKTGLPVVYCTNGQRVPEDIEKASARNLAASLFKKKV